MDAAYFLKSRTEFIRFFYDSSAQGFEDVKRRIEGELPPFDNPPYSEDPEPAYLDEWLSADAALDVLGIACLSMLSDSLKLYLNALQKVTIGFSFVDQKAFKAGFVPAYLGALAEILDTDWSDCPADVALLEQIVLVRNRGQHGEHLSSFTFTHDKAMLEKHPRPFFVAQDELSALTAEEGSLASFLSPSIRVPEAEMHMAIQHVELLADYIEERMDRAHAWRCRSRNPS